MKQIIKMFKDGNVCVCGERGKGKDMLTANVIARRKKNYISNCDYPRKSKRKPIKRTPLDFKVLSMAGNTYKNLLENTVKPFIYPWERGIDIYISDVGVYLPSQFCNELNRDYKGIPQFMALDRQIADCNCHINVQNLNRAWDKLREQSRRYITCLKCKVIKLPLNQQLIIQKVRIYEKYQSCVDNVPPLKLPLYMYMGKLNIMARLYKINYKIQHGAIKERTLIYFNKSDYDTNIFRKIFEKGENKNEN